MMRHRRLPFVLLICGAFVALPVRAARADITDLTGMDARTRGMGMSTLTLCEDWTAAACNLAAGAMSRGVGVGFGYSFTHMQLSLNGQRSDVLAARGTAWVVEHAPCLP